MKRRSSKQALAERPQLGFSSMYPAPGIIERIGQDWDFCWIDAQHGAWNPEDAVQAVRACDVLGILSLLRVPGQEYGVIGRALDTGCDALMVPMVDTVEQAEAVVQAARFPPRGKRSFGGRRAIDLYGRGYSHSDVPQPLVVCQIESEEALNNVDAIAGVDGVDALFFGPDDLSVCRGMAMDKPRPPGCYDAEMKLVADAAKRAGKVAGGIFSTAEAVRGAVEMGYSLIVCCGDVPILSVGSKQAAKTCREALGQDADAIAQSRTGVY